MTTQSMTKKLEKLDGKFSHLNKLEETTCPGTKCLKSGGTAFGGNLKYFLGKFL